MDQLTLSCRVLTPLFMSGPNPGWAELRPPSFRGALRFWYRAADPDYQKMEPLLFGGVGDNRGQGSMLLRLAVDNKPPTAISWDQLRVERFTEGSGRATKNGLIYLGFPFQMRNNNRENVNAIRPGYEFRMHCLVKFPSKSAEDQERLRRGVAAAWWLLAHLGGLGSRSRRGFGSLVLRQWQVEPEQNWPELAALPLLASLDSPQEAREGLERGLATIRQWFGDWKNNIAHPHLGPHFRHELLMGPLGPHDLLLQPERQWDVLLAAMGKHMQAFRLRRAPDYARVKVHLQGDHIQMAPERTTFGLPLTFRFSSVKGKNAMFLPYDSRQYTTFQRHGSLLWLRPVALGEVLHPLYTRLDGAIPGMRPPTTLSRGTRPLMPPGDNAMDRYLDTLKAGKGKHA
ncbi:MAG: hypothetical protein H7831_12280 [Magnetococcus sp. WYHC-3]